MWRKMLTEQRRECRRLKRRAETHCGRDVCAHQRGEVSGKTRGGGCEERHKRLKKGELGRERWVAEQAARNSGRLRRWERERERDDEESEMGLTQRGERGQGGGGSCKAECYFGRRSCFGGSGGDGEDWEMRE